MHGLLALMEIQASRTGARTDPEGNAILLLEQDRSRWNRMAIHRGLAALARAEALGGARGSYALQAAIAACHATAATAEQTDWTRIAALYMALSLRTKSPIVELNRAVAVGMAFGPEPALAIIDNIRNEPKLAGYHLLPAVRGDLLAKLGRHAEAREEFDRSAALTQNERERKLMLARAAESAAKADGERS